MIELHRSIRPLPASVLACALLVSGCASEGERDQDKDKGAGSAEMAHAPVDVGQKDRAIPTPGADLDGPIEVAVADEPGARAGERAAVALDLGADRAIQPVLVPEPPGGGAVPFALDEGRRAWVAHVPDSRQLPAAAYGDGKVYVSGGFDSVTFYAVDATTGRFEWATTNLEDNGPTAAVYEDDRVIFNTESCTLFVLDAGTGKRLWFKYLGDPTLAQTAVSHGLVFAAHPSDDGPRLSAFKLESGARVWSRRVSGELLAAPVVRGDSVYAATIYGVLYRFDRASGKRVWSKKLHVTTAPWIDGDEIFISRKIDREEQQIVVSTETGEVVREHARVAGGYLRDVPRDLDDWRKVWAFEGSRPIVDRGVRYVAMGGDIHASDARSGAARWVRRHADGAGERSVGTVALAGPQVVVSTRDGQIFGLDIDTGYTLWAYDVGHDIVAEPIVARGWVYVTTKDGYLIGLEVGDVTLDGWHMFGGNPGHNGPVSSAPEV